MSPYIDNEVVVDPPWEPYDFTAAHEVALRAALGDEHYEWLDVVARPAEERRQK